MVVTPKVGIKSKSTFSEDALLLLCEQLPQLVAEALHCKKDERGALVPDDVEIWYYPSSVYDRLGKYDIQIVVQANDVPERKKNLENRTRKLRQNIKLLLPRKTKGFVWVRLAPGHFEEF